MTMIALIFTLNAQSIADLSINIVDSEKADKTEEMTNAETAAISLNQLIAENLDYPVLAEEFGLEGTVLVELIFNETGHQARIKRSLGLGCDEAALKVVNQFAPAFKEVYLKEKGSRSVFVPIQFKLN